MRVVLLSRLLWAVRLGYNTEINLAAKAWEKAVQELSELCSITLIFECMASNKLNLKREA